MPTASASITPVTRYKQAQKTRGKAQVLVWMETELRDLVDEVARAKGYKNRSEAVEKLLRETINTKGSLA